MEVEEKLMLVDATETERELEEVLVELRDVFVRHGMGGVVIVGNRQGTIRDLVLPPWSCLVKPDDSNQELHLRVSQSTEPDMACTMNLVHTLQEHCREYAELFGDVFGSALKVLEQNGLAVVQPSHSPDDDTAN